MNDKKDILDIFIKRRSVRKYQDKKIDRDILATILKIGLMAPSAHDSRPWKFYVFENKAKQKLIDTLSFPFEQDLKKACFSEEIIKERLDKSKRIFESAPVLIICFAKAEVVKNPLAKNDEIEKLLCDQSVSMAIMQIVNVARSFGIDSCIFSAPLFCPKEILKLCELDEKKWTPRSLLTLGYSDENIFKNKKTIDYDNKVLFFN